jgi:hypothetical protein
VSSWRGAAALLLALSACGGEEAGAGSGVRFDPTSLVPGDRVGDLTADSLSVRQAGDTGWVGLVHFRGELLLGGHAGRPPDSQPDAVCFEPDSVSGARLPRWTRDRGRPLVCFTNPAAAARDLGSAAEARPATILIDGYTVQRGAAGLTSVARLVRLLARDG